VATSDDRLKRIDERLAEMVRHAGLVENAVSMLDRRLMTQGKTLELMAGRLLELSDVLKGESEPWSAPWKTDPDEDSGD